MSVNVEFNLDDFIRRVSKAADDGAEAAAKVGAEKAQELTGRGTRWSHSAPGSPPSKQTGLLTNSIAYVHPSKLGTPGRAAYGTDQKHGLWMEKGANPRAKGKALPVPINVQAEQMLHRLGGTSLRTQKLAPFKKNGKTFLHEMTASGKKQKKNGAVFVLVKSVRIAPRPWLVPSKNLSGSEMFSAFADVFQKQTGIAPPSGALK